MTNSTFYFSIVMSMSVCLSVCLSDRSHLENHTAELYPMLCACYLWSWLGFPKAALR